MTENSAGHIHRAVEAIADGRPIPDGLVSACERCVNEMLIYRVKDENSVPRRAELRARIDKVAVAAKLILEEVIGPLDKVRFLSDPKFVPLYNYLLESDERHLELDNLISLIRRCDNALSKLPKGPGRGRKVAEIVEENRESGTVMCALLVIHMWKQVHGQVPAEKNAGAQLACAELWAGAGGYRSYWGGPEARTAWRSDLSAALKIVAASSDKSTANQSA